MTDEDLSNEAFPYRRVAEIRVGDIPVMAVRISYVGELGWELYAPSESGLSLWDTIWEAAAPRGAIAAGTGALDSLRLEKGYRLWGSDIHTEYNPFEAGLDFAVRMRKPDFIGRKALAEVKQTGISRRLSCLTLNGEKAIVLGKEPIFVGDSRVGYVTSAGYGYSVGQTIAYGYLPLEHSTPGTKVHVEYFGDLLPATVQSTPLIDPGNERIRS